MSDGNAKRCLNLCPLFEAELLLELMFRQWSHPYVDDKEFRSSLLESTTELLMRASDPNCNEVFLEGMPAQDMNFVSAVWYVEWNSVQDSTEDRAARHQWLDNVRRSLPSCFCDSDLLDEPWKDPKS